jgi:hypothetical protein
MAIFGVGGRRNLVGWMLAQRSSILQCKDSVRIEEKSPRALERPVGYNI